MSIGSKWRTICRLILRFRANRLAKFFLDLFKFWMDDQAVHGTATQTNHGRNFSCICNNRWAVLFLTNRTLSEE